MSVLIFCFWVGSALINLYLWRPVGAAFALHKRYYNFQDIMWALFLGPIGLVWVLYQQRTIKNGK